MQFFNTSSGAHPLMVALADPVTGQAISATVPMAVRIVDGQITITGPVTMPASVEVSNDAGNPLPVTGPVTDTQLRASPLNVYSVSDNTGAFFNLESCSKAYAYSGTLPTSITATNGVNTWIRTYTYSNSLLMSESQWIRQ